MKSSVPKFLLHVEGLIVLATSCMLYTRFHHHWSWFACGFLAPDVFMAGYLVNNRIGAACYNFAHTYVVPLLLAGIFCAIKKPELLSIVLIWSAHIGFDRMLGYGLKYGTAFRDTHLQKV